MAARRPSRPHATATSSLTETVFSRVSSFISRTPRPVWYIGGFLTSSYLLTTFLISKISDLHSRVTTDSNSKDGLKRGFNQNQEDVGFTIMALLPMLGKGMDTVFDVDRITTDLKAGLADRQPSTPLPQSQDNPTLDVIAEPKPEPPAEGASLTPNGHSTSPTTSKPLVNGDAVHSEGVNGTTQKHDGDTADGIASEVPDSAKHVDESQQHSASKSTEQDQARSADSHVSPQKSAQEQETLSDAQKERQEQDRLQAKAEREAEQLRIQEEEARAREAERIRAEQQEATRQATLAADRKRKAALWNELKVISISRYLTTLYAVNLLSILTNVQLSLLGRYSYLRSLSGHETSQESQGPTHTPLAVDPMEDAWARSAASGSSSSAAGSSNKSHRAATITQQVEEEYLTFSWYFLHIGWKNLATRVQAKVEEALKHVPLKSQLNHAETLALLSKIRKRIEYEYEDLNGDSTLTSPPTTPAPFMGAESLMADLPAIPTADGSSSLHTPSEMRSPTSEMSSSMMSTSTVNGKRRQRRRKRFDLLQYLLPSTPEGDLQVLESAGAQTSEKSLRRGTALSSLLDETRDILESRDAQSVARECLTHSFDESFTSIGSAFGLTAEDLDHLTGRSGAKTAAGSLNEGTATEESTASSRIRELHNAHEEEEIRLHPRSHGSRLKLAAVLPVVAREANLITQGMPSQIVESIVGVKDLKAFSAIIYSAWTSGIDA